MKTGSLQSKSKDRRLNSHHFGNSQFDLCSKVMFHQKAELKNVLDDLFSNSFR